MKTLKEINFNDFVKLKRGYDLPNDKIVDGKYPVVASTSIKAFHKEYKVLPPSVVTGRSGSLGEVQFIDMPCWPLNTALYVKNFNKNNPKYVYYFLKMIHLENFNSGAGVPTLNQNHLHKLKIKVHSEKEQQQIAEILSAYDDLIETNNQRIATLEQLAQQIYKEWFVRMRFPGWETTPFHHGIPDEWEQISFGDVAKEVRRHIKLKDLKPNSIYVGLEHLPVKSIALQNWDNAESINSDKLLFHKNDILFCKIRSYLHKVALAPVTGSCSSDTIVIKATEQRFLPYALQIAFCDSFIDFATVTSKGTKMPRADWGVLKKFPIFKPSEQLLEKFNEISLPILEQIQLLSEMNRSFIKTRNLLLPRLISGKLTIKQAEALAP